jgi:hypothetical protein
MLERIKEYLNKPLYAGIAGLFLGLIIGLPILGWWLWPVKWYDASPSDMRSDIQQDFVCMMIDSYARNENASLAVRRFAELGESGPDLLSIASTKNCPATPQDAIESFQTMMKVPANADSGSENNGENGTSTTGTGKSSSSILLLSVLCLVTLLVGAAAFYLFVIKPRRSGTGLPIFGKSKVGEGEATSGSYSGEEQEAPIAQFMTTYVIGDDLYDDSFSIDAPAGEFLGECGVGISETIGNGEPKKVTAFEVWLFDKNDIQTVTKMVMSRFAFNDSTIRQRLMSKGELMQVQPGQRIVLETATLTLEAHVVDMNYGQGGVQPESHFDRLTLELSVWQKV